MKTLRSESHSCSASSFISRAAPGRKVGGGAVYQRHLQRCLWVTLRLRTWQNSPGMKTWSTAPLSHKNLFRQNDRDILKHLQIFRDGATDREDIHKLSHRSLKPPHLTEDVLGKPQCLASCSQKRLYPGHFCNYFSQWPQAPRTALGEGSHHSRLVSGFLDWKGRKCGPFQGCFAVISPWQNPEASESSLPPPFTVANKRWEAHCTPVKFRAGKLHELPLPLYGLKILRHEGCLTLMSSMEGSFSVFHIWKTFLCMNDSVPK